MAGLLGKKTVYSYSIRLAHSAHVKSTHSEAPWDKRQPVAPNDPTGQAQKPRPRRKGSAWRRLDCNVIALHAPPTHTDVRSYDAHDPWQRNSNRNAKGIVHEYLFKGGDRSPFSSGSPSNLECAVNNRPDVVLDIKTPQEVFTWLKIAQLSDVTLQPQLGPQETSAHA